MKINWALFASVIVIIGILSQRPLIPDVIIFSSFSAGLFILYVISSDSLFFLGGIITLFGAIGVSSIGYNPYSIFTILVFSVPVFLSILFMETLMNSETGMKRISIQVLISVLSSILFIYVFGTYSIQETDIISLSILLVILAVALYYFLDALSSKQ